MLDAEQFYLLGWIQTSQAGGQLSSDTFPYGECYMEIINLQSNTEAWYLLNLPSNVTERL